MGIEDADGQRGASIARASIVDDGRCCRRSSDALSDRGAGVRRQSSRRRLPQTLGATAAAATSAGALAAVRERYRGRPVAGIVLLSDGGDTSAVDAAPPTATPAPVFAIGIGARDRRPRPRGAERHRGRGRPGRLARRPGGVRGQPRARAPRRSSCGCSRTAGRSKSAASRRRPTARRSREVFHVAPARGAPTVYTSRFPRRRASSCRRTTRAACSCSRRRGRAACCSSQGAPGFEHSFLNRALERRPRPRGRFGRAQGQERAGARHVLHPGGAVAQRRAARPAIRPRRRGSVRLRRDRARQRRRRIS